MTARQARFQIVDVIASMKPLTKMTRQIVSAGSDPDHRARRLPGRHGGAAGPGASGTARGRRGRGDRPDAAPIVPAHPIERPGRAPGGPRPGGRDDPGGQAPADHDRRRRQPAALARASVELRAPHPAAVLQHADGQGRGHRRLEPLHGHGRAVGARLCAPGDRPGRPDHRDRPRHDREAALHHGRGRPAGDPYRLHVGQCGAGLLSRMPRWSATSGRASRSWPTGSTASSSPDAGLPGPAGRNPRAHQRTRRRGSLPGHAAAHRARRARGDAGRRDRLPRQRHVQDLVRAQLPHARRQHAAARQRARHHGRGPALGHDGRRCSIRSAA